VRAFDRRGFARMLAAAPLAGLLPASSCAMQAADDPVLGFVDPELRPAAREFLSHPLPRTTDAALRRQHAAPAVPDPAWLPTTPVEKRMIRGRAGAPDVKIYVINAKPGSGRAGILHMHGGGFIFSNAASNVRELQGTAAALDCTIVTVDYRLAPEARWNGSLEDNYAGLEYLYRHADELGVDRRRIAVMGESAGGGHAALLALTARDRGEVPLAFQALTYPMLDDRTGTSRAVAFPIGRILWTPALNKLGWASFLGVDPGGRSVPKGAVPARFERVKGLPPTFIGVGAID